MENTAIDDTVYEFVGEVYGDGAVPCVKCGELLRGREGIVVNGNPQCSREDRCSMRVNSRKDTPRPWRRA
jgi:hypothetical protein